MSTRTDLLSKEYIDVLSELQDSLPPLNYVDVKDTIENELRKPVEKIFKSIDSEPLASASIGQVHKAELINGSQVVIKIQRPGLRDLFYQDLSILRCLALYMERHVKLAQGREWVSIVDEIGKTLFEEIDFIQEGRNADKFRKNLKSEEKIYIPKIFWQYTTRKIIMLEYVPGIKITDVDALKEKGHNPKELANTLVNGYFKQFFEDGFYHADPHPGNIVVRDDGTIIFYDFGMVGRINKNIRKELTNVLVSVVTQDTETFLSTLKGLDLIKPNTDIEPLKRVINEVLYSYYDGAKLNSLNLTELQDDLKILLKEKPLKLPGKFAYTLRMTGALEGVCRTLNPDFSLTSVAKPYLHNWIKSRSTDSLWEYFKALFPKENPLVKKIYVYADVLKEVPSYITAKEKMTETNNNDNLSQPQNTYSSQIGNEIEYTNLKLKSAYNVIFLLCTVIIGIYLIQINNPMAGFIGFLLLSISLLSSIWIVFWSIIMSDRLVGEK
jgi:predicted unusual protein kinase regulating ubiquinone biosynthesis (AarF/ABC1/UbiB family)